MPKRYPFIGQHIGRVGLLLVISVLLANYWKPLADGGWLNWLFVVGCLGAILLVFYLLHWQYAGVLAWCLRNKGAFVVFPIGLVGWACLAFFGFNNVCGWVARGGVWLGQDWTQQTYWQRAAASFPGLGQDFLPALDEGSFLLMPTAMTHVGVEESERILQKLDQQVAELPEVKQVIGKAGRVASALDPAPLSMYENMIEYQPMYAKDDQGNLLRFKVNDQGLFILPSGEALDNEAALNRGLGAADLIIDPRGALFRNWRAHIRNSQDIWEEISRATQLPGVTGAPKLYPIQSRLVMLQTGIRATLGIKILGDSLTSITQAGERLANYLRQVPMVAKPSVYFERSVNKPTLVITLDREKLSHYGIQAKQVQQALEVGIGGKALGVVLQGRERITLRARYARTFRADPTRLKEIVLYTADQSPIPLGEVVEVSYEAGTALIQSENTFLVGYVLFDKIAGYTETDVVDQAQQHINEQLKKDPLPKGVRYAFTGNYENILRAQRRLSLVIPAVLLLIIGLLYRHFKNWLMTAWVFISILLAASGGMVLLWLYGQEWFLDMSLGALALREVFSIEQVPITVAVWVGFIALFGLATDDSVLMGTNLRHYPCTNATSVMGLHYRIICAARQRIRPAIMTSTTTLIALLPILGATGRGADLMIPMSIPLFGGMLGVSLSYYLLPVLYAWSKPNTFKKTTTY